MLAKKELCFRPHTLPGTNLRIAFLPTTKDKAVREAFDADAGYGALPALSLPLAPSLPLSLARALLLSRSGRARTLSPHTLSSCSLLPSLPIAPMLMVPYSCAHTCAHTHICAGLNFTVASNWKKAAREVRSGFRV